MNIPPDNNGPPNPGLGFDPNQAAMMTGDVALTGQNKSKAPLVILGVLAVGAGGFFAWHSKKARDERVQHVNFMQEFQSFEKDDLGKFWLCALGPNADGTTMNDPRQVTGKVDVMFANDFKEYPVRVQDDCVNAAKDAAAKVTALAGRMPLYTMSVEEYAKSINDMAAALAEWGKAAPAQVEAKMVAKNMDEYSTAWRGFTGGAPTPEVMGFDQFLHCAVPDADTKYKDDLELAKFIFDSCKAPGYAERLNNECGKLLSTKQTTPTKNWKAAIQKYAADSDARDAQALEACMKKGRKGKVKDNLAPVAEKWVSFREAREKVLKIGQEALKE